MHQKIRQYLNEKYLGWVIIDSISHTKLISLMSRLNIEYTGVRITSIPRQNLAYDLAEEAFAHKEVMDALAAVLDKVNFDEAQKVSQMTEHNLRALIAPPDDIYLPEKMGKIIWALLSDPRKVANRLIPMALKVLEDAIEISKHSTTRVDRKAKKEIIREKGVSADLMKKNKRLEEKDIERQKIIHQLRKSCGELTQEKGVWHKRIMKKEAETQNLRAQIKELKEQLTVGPKMRLKSELHRLQKENNKLNYISEKEHRENKARISNLEKELLQLKENSNELQQANTRMHQQIEKEKERFEQLQRDYQSVSVRKEPLPVKAPKEKGNRLGIFIDNQNVYYSAKTHYGKKLDYRKLPELLVRGRYLVKAICYIVQQPEANQEKFIDMLKNNHYTVRTRELIRRADGSVKGNWDTGIVADVITMVEKNSLDIVALVTCDGDFVDLVKWLSAKRIRVEVIGFPMNMAMDLKKTADEYYFITEDLML